MANLPETPNAYVRELAGRLLEARFRAWDACMTPVARKQIINDCFLAACELVTERLQPDGWFEGKEE